MTGAKGGEMKQTIKQPRFGCFCWPNREEECMSIFPRVYHRSYDGVK